MANTINYYELRRAISGIECEINTKLHEAAFKDDTYVRDYVRITYVDYPGKPIELKVNWCCIGETTPEKALAFAEALREAAEYCRTSAYNGMTVTYGEEE